MTPQAVIFDIGNVLIEWNPERYYDRAIGEDRRRELFAQVDLPGMNARVDLGENFTSVVTGFARQHPDWQADIMLWHDSWIEMAQPAIDRSVRLLRALRRADVPVLALSNFGIETFEIAVSHYPFLEEFDRRYISGHMGAMKPDPRIYAAVEADCGLPPQALLFTDDRPENIAAAAARGWQTHLFDGPQGWADRLVRAGLVTPEAAA